MAKILVVGKFYPPFRGGTETYTRDVCESLARTHEVTALVYNHERGEKEETQNGVLVTRCNTQVVSNGQPIALSLFWKMNLSSFDLIHFHAPNFFANVVLLLRLLAPRNRKIPIVVTHHMDVYGRRLLRTCVIPLYRALLRRSSMVVVTSDKNAKNSNDLLFSTPTVAIPLGIDPENYRRNEAASPDAKRRKRQLVGDAKVVCFIGRHARYKGLNILIRAVQKLPDVHAFIAGDGPYRKPAQILARDIGVGERIHFLGSVSEKEKKSLIAVSDVFVLPSTEVTEAFGITQLEAMALGTPVIASDLPSGVTDIAIDRKTALLARPGDPDALANAINEMLENTDLRRIIVEEATAHVREKFTLNNMLIRTEQIFDEVMLLHGRRRAERERPSAIALSKGGTGVHVD